MMMSMAYPLSTATPWVTAAAPSAVVANSGGVPFPPPLRQPESVPAPSTVLIPAPADAFIPQNQQASSLPVQMISPAVTDGYYPLPEAPAVVLPSPQPTMVDPSNTSPTTYPAYFPAVKPPAYQLSAPPTQAKNPSPVAKQPRYAMGLFEKSLCTSSALLITGATAFSIFKNRERLFQTFPRNVIAHTKAFFSNLWKGIDGQVVVQTYR